MEDRLLSSFWASFEYYPHFIELTGSVQSAVLLSAAYKMSYDAGGWFTCTFGEWSELLGMNRTAFVNARNRCVKNGLLSFVVSGLPAVSKYKVNFENFPGQ